LSPDLQGNELLSRYKSPEEAMRGFVEAQKLIGKKEIIQGLVAPGENATDVERQAFQAQLGEMIGVPKSAEEYMVGEQKLPEELKGFAKVAHGLNLSNDQFAGLVVGLTELDEAMEAETTQELARTETENLASLKTDWGRQYDQNMATANKALEAFGDDALLAYIIKNNATTEPAVLHFFHRLGTQLEEGALKLGDGGQTPPVATEEQRAKELEATDAFWNPHLDGGKTRREVGELRMKLGRQGA
jgi:hypothetical protein